MDLEQSLNKESRIFKGDPIIWYIVLALSIFSILVVYSATQTLAYRMREGDTVYYLKKHSVLVILAIVVMWLAHRIDYRYYAGLSRYALWASVPLLVFTIFFGQRFNEASRVLPIPLIDQSFQPSDLAKLALVAHLATMLSRKQQDIRNFKDAVLPMLGWVVIICGLIALNNFSNAFILFCTCLLVMFIGRIPIRFFVMIALVGAIAIGTALRVGSRWETFVSRVESYWVQLTDSEKMLNDSESKSFYQSVESMIAVSSGGITGKGPGNSDQQEFLPQPYSDFIFSILIEEYGLVGGMFVIFLYLALLYRGMTIMSRSNRAFGGLLAAGLAFSLVIQALVHMGVAVGLLPVTGLPLPLLSMGGTSLLFTGISIGIVLSVSRGDINEEARINE